MYEFLERLGIREHNPGGCCGVNEWMGEGDTIASVNPASGKTIATVGLVSEGEYDTIVSAAQAAFHTWRMVPGPVRGTIVRDIGLRLEERKEDLARLVALEMGKILEEARGEHVAGMMAAQNSVQAIFSGPRDSGLVALTIDDGPHPLVTPLMLDILREAGVRATFFIVGQKIEEFPALARATVRDGHELANHAYSNRRLHELTDDEAWAEIAACKRVVERVTGAPMRFFRPPGGRCSPGGLRAVASFGYTVAFWSRNTGDWRKPPAEVICRNATEGLQAGDVILMHQGDICSVEALPMIIARVRALGLEPTTLAALADAGGVIADDPVSISGMVNGQLGEE